MPTSLPVFMDEVPDYAVRDGRMYISIGTFCMAMPIPIFLMGCARGKEAIAKWQVAELDNERSVVPFSRR